MLVINYSRKNLCHVALGLISFPPLNDVELHNTQDRGYALGDRQGKGPVTVNLPSRNVNFWRDVVRKVCLYSSPFSSDISVRCR